jgi:toxin-antitoxin system PIN domain toxin
MTKTYLPDINFWLALVFEVHVHHAVASAWMAARADDVCVFCRLTQQGFLRLASNPKVFRDDAVTLAGAWQLFDTVLSDPRVTFAEEPAQVEVSWRTLTQENQYSPHVWSDAYLVAFATAAGHELITFDRALSRYQHVTVL